MNSLRLRISAFCLATIVALSLAYADEGFPFGLEMTLDASPMPGTKRLPTLEIDDAGETRVELWCGGGRGQFSVAGNTVVFAPGANETRTCTPAQGEADVALLEQLTAAGTWQREGDLVTLTGGPTPLRFRINTN